jgi:hypothetical protein
MPNHLLHFIITFFTCGLWIIPWVLIAIEAEFRPFRCPTCGTAGTNAPVQKSPATSQPVNQRPRVWRPLAAGVAVIGLACLFAFALYLTRQVDTESKPNPTVSARPSATPMLATSAESATPEIRKAKPVLPPPSKGSLEPDRFTEKTGTKPTSVSDAAVIAHAHKTADEVTAAMAADPLHDHFPKPDPAFFNSLSDRQYELWNKEFMQRRLQGQIQRQHTPKENKQY